MAVRTRADRRHQMDRARGRAKAVIRFAWGRRDADDPVVVGRVASTRTPCSCWMCANERRTAKGHKRLSIQERREFQD